MKKTNLEYPNIPEKLKFHYKWFTQYFNESGEFGSFVEYVLLDLVRDVRISDVSVYELNTRFDILISLLLLMERRRIKNEEKHLCNL